MVQIFLCRKTLEELPRVAGPREQNFEENKLDGNVWKIVKASPFKSWEGDFFCNVF